MDKHQNFANNLNAIRKSKQLSLSEFSEELGIPKSTLQSVLEEGQTTLNTALRISEALDIPLDALTKEQITFENILSIKELLNGIGWFDSLSHDDQKSVIFYLNKIWELIQK